MKAGIMGVDCFLSKGIPRRVFLEPLSSVFSISSVIPLTDCVPFIRGGMSRDGEADGLVSEGVSICSEVVLELDRECVFVLRGLPPNERLGELLVIACSAGSSLASNTFDQRSCSVMTSPMVDRC